MSTKPRSLFAQDPLKVQNTFSLPYNRIPDPKKSENMHHILYFKHSH